MPFRNCAGNWGEFQIFYQSTPPHERSCESSIWPSLMLLGWTENKLLTLKRVSKSIQLPLILRKRHPKPYKLFYLLWFPDTLKNRQTYVIFISASFKMVNDGIVTKLIKRCKNIVLGDALSSTLEKFAWILNRVLRSKTWYLCTLEASNLVKWQVSMWSFMWWRQFIDWLRQRPPKPCMFIVFWWSSSHWVHRASLCMKKILIRNELCED